jgi:hypothetical protein
MEVKGQVHSLVDLPPEKEHIVLEGWVRPGFGLEPAEEKDVCCCHKKISDFSANHSVTYEYLLQT